MRENGFDIAPAAVVRVHRDWARNYRRQGGSESGVVVALSPTRAVARVRMDDVADSYIHVDHLELESQVQMTPREPVQADLPLVETAKLAA